MKLLYVSLMMFLVCHVSSPLFLSRSQTTPWSNIRPRPAVGWSAKLCLPLKLSCLSGPNPLRREICDSERDRPCLWSSRGGSMSRRH